MSLRSVEAAVEQVESGARNAARSAVAAVRRETSITGWANRLVAGVERRSRRNYRDEGVYILSAEEVRQGRRIGDVCFVTPDGYIRRSPVQEIVEAPGYRRGLILRAVMWTLGVVAAGAVAYVLARLGVIGI